MIILSLVKFSGTNILFALGQMQFAHKHLSQVEGLRFYKLMGSGAGNGFSIWPDLTTFCLLAEWTDRSNATAFYDHHPFWKKYSTKGNIIFQTELSPTKTMGTWGSINPFEDKIVTPDDNLVAVLTRATIKPRHLIRFWKEVPAASKPVGDTKGHIYSKGIGEWPLFMQATISIWKSREHMYEYAYRNKAHIDMIKKTRQLGWYKEEMFSEFNVIKITVDKTTNLRT